MDTITDTLLNSCVIAYSVASSIAAMLDLTKHRWKEMKYFRELVVVVCFIQICKLLKV